MTKQDSLIELETQRRQLANDIATIFSEELEGIPDKESRMVRIRDRVDAVLAKSKGWKNPNKTENNE